jgi:hypothetical protein
LEAFAGMMTDINSFLLEVHEKCSQECYATLLAYVEELEEEIEFLEVEIESMNTKPRRRRPKEEDWR